jgi:hypothetical protein
MIITLRPRPTPSFDDMSELLREQLGPLLEQAEEDGPDGFELISLFDVLDEGGKHVYDLHLFCGEDGQVFLKDTLEHVASFSQGTVTCKANPALESALEEALAES